MKIHQDNSSAIYQIQSYQPGVIQINQKNYLKSLIISAQQLVEDWPPQNFEELLPQHFDWMETVKPEILLLGTGHTQQFLSPELMEPFIRMGVGIEVMNTFAACSTFQVLTSEDRNVWAALIIE